MDVDLAGLAWTPILNFGGTFNGNGHTVSNMYVALDTGNSGFFDALRSATVKNLVLEQAQVIVPEANHASSQGILAGFVQSGTVENCGVHNGSITANLQNASGLPSAD